MSLQLSVQSADMDIGQVPHAQWPERCTVLHLPRQRVSTFCRFVWFFAEIEIVIILTARSKREAKKEGERERGKEWNMMIYTAMFLISPRLKPSSADFPVHAMSAANNVNYKSKTNSSFIVVAPTVVVVVVAV